MTVAAQAAGVVGSAGLAALYLGASRSARLAGLVAWTAALGVLGVYLLPDLSRSRLGAAAVGGLVVSVGVAVLLRRWPYLLAFATLACIPLRLPVDIGSDEVNLLLPLYAVIGGLALSLGWSLLHGDDRSRELGPVALPLAAFVGWTGLSLVWAVDVRRGAILLGAFLLPFGLLALGFARLPWRGRWLTWLWGGLVATALLYALVGGYQWLTRDVFWNPSVKVFNAYAPFFRVNSVFWDPSVYGRYLTVAILASLAGIVLGGVRGWRVAGLYAVVVATWLGLLISFSQSSFVALAAGIVVAVAVAWGRRATLALVTLGLLTAVVVLAVPQVRDELVGKSRSGFDRITSGTRRPRGPGRPHRPRPPARGSRSRRLLARVRPQARDPGQGPEAGRLAHDARHGRGRGGSGRPRAPLLASRGRVPRNPHGPRPGLHVAGLARHRGRPGRDRRAQPLLRRVLRGPDDVGALRLDRAHRTRAEEDDRPPGGADSRAFSSARAGTGPHTHAVDSRRAGRTRTRSRPRAAHGRRRVRVRRHDGAPRGGGLRGALRRVSIATRSLPPGFEPDTLAREVREATAELGIPSRT